MAFVQCKCIIHECHVYSSRPALFNSDVVHSFTQVCWRHHNATLSHSKCFSIGICSLSHKMESEGGLGIWKGHIWGPPLWVFTFKDKWSYWVPASCEWAPSAHTGFLNAHQNNLSKPRDTFLRCLMWGQIGNHFNKIPLGWNCISQKSKHWPDQGETLGTPTVEGLPEVFKGCLKSGDLLCWQVYSRHTCNFIQKLYWGIAEDVVSLDIRSLTTSKQYSFIKFL